MESASFTVQRRPRGRPRKNPLQFAPESVTSESAGMDSGVSTGEQKPRGPGRPKGSTNTKRAEKTIEIAEDVSEKILTNVATIFGVSLSGFTNRRFGSENGMTVKEGISVTQPVARLVARHMPTLNIDTRLPKDDAKDVEQIILTIVEYCARLVAQALAKARMRAAGLSQERLEELRREYQSRYQSRTAPPAQEMEPDIPADIPAAFVPESMDTAIAVPETNGKLGEQSAELFSAFDAPTDSGENLTN